MVWEPPCLSTSWAMADMDNCDHAVVDVCPYLLLVRLSPNADSEKADSRRAGYCHQSI